MTALSVTADQTVTVSASYTSDGVTKQATKSVIIKNVSTGISLSGLTINGPSSVDESSSGTYTTTAAWSDSTTSPVTPLWSDNSLYTTISSGGVLTTSSVTADQTVTVSASYTSGGVTKTATKSVSINSVTQPGPESPPVEVLPGSVVLARADLGVITEPMQVVISPEDSIGSYISTSTKYFGTAVYNFNITEPGTYKIIGDVYGMGRFNDSFFVNIDNGTDDVWDFNPTGEASLYNVWRQDEVTARGTGTEFAPQFNPLLVELEAGPHTITFRGRELNSRLAYFYLLRAPTVTELIEADSGEITSPMRIVTSAEAPGGGYIETTTNYLGSARYNFNIVDPGTYKIIGNAYGTGRFNDSFFVKIDNGADDIWDLNPKEEASLYNVWRQDEVAARGNGTEYAPQFDPLEVQLAAGPHTITFRGRELNTRLANFYLKKISGPLSIIKLEITEIPGQ
jgi:hypothetical protein